jgi:hypothetical protein
MPSLRIPDTVARLARFAVAGTLLVTVFPATPALAQCSSEETGRWVNVKPDGDPAQIEVYFAECGDTPQTRTRMAAKVFVKQSSGALYQRAPVTATHIVDQKTGRWLLAKVTTGGYQDHMYMRVIRRGNDTLLKVFIRHKSLDQKPDATSWHEYRRR